MTGPDDLARDAWLSEALRHAPDLTAAPPAALTDAILREAAAKAVTRPEPRALDAAGRLWTWIARPPVAAGFATLMVATLVGLMWWDRPMNEALPRPPLREQTTDAPRPAPAEPPAAARSDAASAAARVAAPSPAAAKATQKPAAPISPPAAPAPVPAPVPAPPAAATVEQKAEEPALAARAPTAPTPPPMAASPQVSRSAPALADRLSASDAAGAERARRAVGRVDEDAPSTLAGLRAAIAAQPARWTWQSGSAPPQPFTPALTAWLAQVEAAVGGRRMTMDGNATSTRELRLWRDGRPLQAFRLSGSTLHWQRADEAAGGVAVDLGEPAVRRLIDSLDAAIR